MFTHVAGASVAGVHADHAGRLEADSPSVAAVRIRSDGNLDALQSNREAAATCQNMQKESLLPVLCLGLVAAFWRLRGANHAPMKPELSRMHLPQRCRHL
jgi:hypothetical protein